MATLDELQAQLTALTQRVNEITAPPDDYYTHRFSGEEIEAIVRTETIPPHLAAHETEPLYGEEHPLLLRRVSGSVRLNLFEGGHDMLSDAAFAWLEKQRRGSAPDWSVCGGVRNAGNDGLSS